MYSRVYVIPGLAGPVQPVCTLFNLLSRVQTADTGGVGKVTVHCIAAFVHCTAQMHCEVIMQLFKNKYVKKLDFISVTTND